MPYTHTTLHIPKNTIKQCSQYPHSADEKRKVINVSKATQLVCGRSFDYPGLSIAKPKLPTSVHSVLQKLTNSYRLQRADLECEGLTILRFLVTLRMHTNFTISIIIFKNKDMSNSDHKKLSVSNFKPLEGKY